MVRFENRSAVYDQARASEAQKNAVAATMYLDINRPAHRRAMASQLIFASRRSVLRGRRDIFPGALTILRSCSCGKTRGFSRHGAHLL